MVKVLELFVSKNLQVNEILIHWNKVFKLFKKFGIMKKKRKINLNVKLNIIKNTSSDKFNFLRYKPLFPNFEIFNPDKK